ncbi:MAG: lipopolysaccharide kinase InaA family protein [Anaerolineae bacterium]
MQSTQKILYDHLPDKTDAIHTLIVEPNVLWRDAHTTALEAVGYSVTHVETPAEALELIQVCHFHLVIFADQDNEALAFIEEYKWSKHMVVCVCSERVGLFGNQIFWLSDLDATGKVMERVLYFSKKKYFPKAFIDRIQSELEAKRLIGKLKFATNGAVEHLSYRMANNLIDHIQSTNPATALQPQDAWIKIFYEEHDYEALRQRIEYEIYDLLRRCIQVDKIDTITLISIDNGLSKAAVIGVMPNVGGIWSRTYILKVGYHKEIENERRAYDNHVNFLLSNMPNAKQGPSTPLLSSIMYDFIEHTASFSEFYKDLNQISLQQIEELLDNLFKKVYLQWFSHPIAGHVRASNYMDYLNCYVNRFIDPIQYLESTPDLQGYRLWGVDRFRLPGIPIILDNPIEVLDDDDFLSKLDYPATLTITHGDLNPNNILVRLINDQPEAWLIDFARTADQTHVLRDFIQLESAVRFALLEQATLKERYEMESILAGQRSFSQVDALRSAYTPLGPNSRALERAYFITCKIRELAWETALNRQSDDRQVAKFKQYKMGLFFTSLNTVRFVKHHRAPSGLSVTQGLHALMAASLLMREL